MLLLKMNTVKFPVQILGPDTKLFQQDLIIIYSFLQLPACQEQGCNYNVGGERGKIMPSVKNIGSTISHTHITNKNL